MLVREARPQEVKRAGQKLLILTETDQSEPDECSGEAAPPRSFDKREEVWLFKQSEVQISSNCSNNQSVENQSYKYSITSKSPAFICYFSRNI